MTSRIVGRVVLLGDVGKPVEQRLSSDVVRRGISIRGVHDGHNDDRLDVPRAIAAFFQRVAAGRFPLDGLVTHRFKPGQTCDAYELLATKRQDTMTVLFDWM